MDAFYLNSSKAFDSVPHRRMLMKLEGYGIKGTLKVIEDLSIARICVELPIHFFSLTVSVLFFSLAFFCSLNE